MGDLVIKAIKELNEPRTGSSLQSIKKYVQANIPKSMEYKNGVLLLTLKRVVSSGALVQTKGSYEISPEAKKAELKKTTKAKKKPVVKKSTTKKKPMAKKTTTKKKSAAKKTSTKKKPAAKKKTTKKTKTAPKKAAPKKKKVATKK